MKSLTKKLLSIFMVLCLTLMSFGLAISVRAATGDIVFTISGDTTGFVENGDGTTGSKSLVVNQQTLNYTHSGVKTKSSNTSKTNYGYAMFNKNSGFIYSTNAIAGYYPSSVKCSFTKGTGKNGQVKGVFGAEQISTRQSTDCLTIIQEGSLTFENNDPTKLYWNLSSNNANVQITEIVVTYTLAGVVSEAVAVPSNIVLEDNLISFDAVQNATSYNIGLFLNQESQVPYKVFEVNDTNAEILVEEQGEFFVRVKALSNLEGYTDSAYSSVVGPYVNNIIKEKTIGELNTMASDEKEVKTYYKISGEIQNISNTTYGNFDLVGATGTIPVYGLTKTKQNSNDNSFESLGLKENDFIVLYGYLGKYKGQIRIEGAYFGEKIIDNQKIFENKSTMATMYVNYISRGKTGNLLNSDFIYTSSADKTLPEGWTGEVGGSYDSSYWQSFRSNNENIVSPKFDSQSNIEVSFTYYLNNSKDTGSSQVKFEALDANEQVVSTFTSENIGKGLTGADNAKTIVASLTGEGIVKIKVTFIKDNGGNIAFNNIKVRFPKTYELVKDSESNKNQVGLRFGTQIDAELYNNLNSSKTSNISFGVAYLRTDQLGSKTIKEAINDNTAIMEECTPVLIDEQGKESQTGTMYQYALVLDHIPTVDFDKQITAACYVCIDGTYYVMQQKAFSVIELSQYYIDNLANDPSVAPHIEMLNWLVK